MSKYTNGEIARLCGVSVRTVQYYDERGILVPSELSEGGRRLCTSPIFTTQKHYSGRFQLSFCTRICRWKAHTFIPFYYNLLQS